MGYAYHELILPAIVFEHPGKNKEELAKLRDSVPEPPLIFREEDPWNKSCNSPFPKGFERLARELRLNLSPQTEESILDSNGIPIEPAEPYFEIDDKENPYKVYVNIFNKPKETRRLHVGLLPGEREFKTGEFLRKNWLDWEDPFGQDYSGILIKDIVKKLEVSRGRNRKDFWAWNPDFKKGYIDYEIIGTLIERWFYEENFPSEEEMYFEWPELRPEVRFDFNQSEGHFDVLYNAFDYVWVKKDGKYYIDDITFQRIPVSLLSRKWEERSPGDYFPDEAYGYGYTDLILTTEAIRNKAWKVFSYRGKDGLEKFLQDFPESRARYEKAVIDAETSLNAKQRGLTVTEFLRMRIRADVLA